MSATPPEVLQLSLPAGAGREKEANGSNDNDYRSRGADKERSRSRDRGRDKDKDREREKKRRDRDRGSKDRESRRRDSRERERDRDRDRDRERERDRDSRSHRSRSRNHDDSDRRKKRSRSKDRDRRRDRDRDSRSRRSGSRGGGGARGDDYDRSSRRRRSNSRSYDRRRNERSNESHRNSRERSSRERSSRERAYVNPFDTNNRNSMHEPESRIPSLFERHHQNPQLESIREENNSRFDLSQTIQDLMSNVGGNKSFAALFSSQNSNDSMSNGFSENSMDAAERKRKRKSRWGGTEKDKTFIPGMPTILPSTLDPAQQEAYLVQFQIEEISRKLRTGDLGITQTPEERFETVYSHNLPQRNHKVSLIPDMDSRFMGCGITQHVQRHGDMCTSLMKQRLLSQDKKYTFLFITLYQLQIRLINAIELFLVLF